MTTTETKVLADVLGALRAINNPDGECIDVILFYVTRCLEAPPSSVSRKIVSDVVQAAVESNVLVKVDSRYLISPEVLAKEQQEAQRLTSQSIARPKTRAVSLSRNSTTKRRRTIKTRGCCSQVMPMICDDCRRGPNRRAVGAPTKRATAKKRKARSPTPLPTKRVKLATDKRRAVNQNYDDDDDDDGDDDDDDGDDDDDDRSSSSEESTDDARSYWRSSTGSYHTSSMTIPKHRWHIEDEENDIRALLTTVSGQLKQVIEHCRLCLPRQSLDCMMYGAGGHHDGPFRRDFEDLPPEAFTCFNHTSNSEMDVDPQIRNFEVDSDIPVEFFFETARKNRVGGVSGESGEAVNIDPNFGEVKQDHLDCMEEQDADAEAMTVAQSDSRSERKAQLKQEVEAVVQGLLKSVMYDEDGENDSFQDHGEEAHCHDDKIKCQVDMKINSEDSGFSLPSCPIGARSLSMANLLSVDYINVDAVSAAPPTVSTFERSKSTSSLSYGRLELTPTATNESGNR